MLKVKKGNYFQIDIQVLQHVKYLYGGDLFMGIWESLSWPIRKVLLLWNPEISLSWSLLLCVVVTSSEQSGNVK